MPNCFVAGCKNIGVHLFPKNAKLRKKWEIAVKGNNFKASFHARLCTIHFKNEDYVKERNSSGVEQKVLKSHAVPSIFPWSETESSIKAETPQNEALEGDCVVDDSSDPLEIGDTLQISSLESSAQFLEASERLRLSTVAPSQHCPYTTLYFGTCRFCASQGEHRNMMSEYMTQGERENYSDMLLECFNIFISTDATNSSLICSVCVARLRDARSFRHLVVCAEQGLRRALDTVGVEVSLSQLPGEVNIKLEPEDPGPDVSEPVVKTEPDIEIVEHGVTGKPGVKSGDRRMKTGAADMLYDDSDVEGDFDTKRELLEEYITNRLDSLLAGIKAKRDIDLMQPDVYVDRNNEYACCPESVDKFLEEYYKGKYHSEDEENIDEDSAETPEKSVMDLEQENAFLSTSCGCRKKCLNRVNRNEVLKSRLDCLELAACDSQNNLNLVVLGALNAIIDTGKRHENHPQLREKTMYLFRGHPVCKTLFLYAYGLDVQKFQYILKRFIEHGVAKRQKTTKITKVEENTDVVRFIKNFSEQNSLVLPGRSLDKNPDLHILPSSMNRTSVYEEYVKACKKDKRQAVSRAMWYRCWEEFCPNIVVRTSDPCKICQDILSVLSKTHSIDTKAKRLKEALDHLNSVQFQRVYYQNITAQVASLVMVDRMALGPHIPCSYDGLVHYSFDYLQQIHLPHYPHESGPVDFLDSFKVSLFGVAIEPLQKFVMYVIPESCVSKGVNVVISLLNHFFCTFALGETHVVCHADNTNQDKDDVLIQYAVWRVMSGLHKSFQLSYLPKGHSNFAPDLYFGLFKSKLRESTAYTLMDICKIAVSADSRSDSIIGVIVGSETGDVVNVLTCDWAKFFSDHNPAPIPDLPAYLHFKTDTLNFGAVMCSKSSPNDYSDQVRVFDAPFGFSMPNIVQKDVSLERRKYLYDNIRDYVAPEFRDVLCPIPNEAAVETTVRKEGPKLNDKPLDQSDLLDDQDEKKDDCNGVKDGVKDIPKGSKKRRTMCSYCGLVGHRNQRKRGRYICNKRQLDSKS